MYTLAGDQQVTMNVHHVTNCVRNWGPSGAIVAFSSKHELRSEKALPWHSKYVKVGIW